MFHLAPLGTQSNTTWHHQPEPSDGKLPLRLILSSNKVTHDSLSRIRVAGGELWFPLKSKRNSNLVVPQKNQFTSLLVVLNSFTTSACELSMYHIWFYIFPLQSAAAAQHQCSVRPIFVLHFNFQPNHITTSIVATITGLNSFSGFSFSWKQCFHLRD